MPILMTREEYDRIKKWTNPDKEDPEAKRQREYIEYLDKQSAEITKSWPNSLENVNKRNEEMRRARTESHDNANARFYKNYVKRKKEEQERMMYSARDMIFKNKDAPKLLLSAVVESVILKEREEQIKFNNKYVGEYEREQARLYEEKVLRQAKEWNELQQERKRRRFQFNKQHQKDILDQIKEIDDRKRKEYEEELTQQKMDIENSNKEMQAIKEFEMNFKETERQRIWRDNEQAVKEREQRKREQAMRDHMDDQLLEVLTRSQARVEARRKATEKEIRDEKLRLLDAISKRLETSTSERDAKEQASFVKAIAERNAAVEARQKAALEKKERHRRDKMVAHEQFLRDEEQRLHEEETMAQWGLMNRFKNQEIYDEYRENMRKEKERKEKEYREAIIKQEEETTALAARARQESLHFYGALAEQKFREADNKLLTYSLQLLEEARRNGRPTLPIKKAIDRYCKMYRLYPMPNLPKSLQEHFAGYAPRDGSTPDVDYQEPPPPPPERSLTEMDDKYERQKRDGLQKIFKAPKPKESPKSSEMKPQESLPDYKRQGRANGLQRKKTPPPREEIVLPPITVVTYPCKQLGLVSTEPIKTEQPCDCVQFGEI